MKEDVFPEEILRRVVTVDRETPLSEILEKAGFKVYDYMAPIRNLAPLAETVVTVALIRIGRYIVCDELEAELAKRGLRSSFDPWAIAAWFMSDSQQVARYPVAMQGVNKDRRPIRADFSVIEGVPSVTFDHFDVGWRGDWYFSAQAL